MNQESIFLKLNIVFILAVSFITALFVYFLFQLNAREEYIDVIKTREISKAVNSFRKHRDFERLREVLDNQDLKIVKNPYPILQNAREAKINLLINDQFIQIVQKGFQILTYKDRKYFYVNEIDFQLLLRDESKEENLIYYSILIYLSILAIFTFIYIALRKSLLPLKKLECEIKKFGEGSLDISTKSDKSDEISLVANEFHNAVEKIKNLRNARKLFLRNIMHELKTPITKGKICIELINDEINKSILSNVFNRLEVLINEMSEIERLSSNNIRLNLKEYKLIDILENAIELLYIDKSLVTHNLKDESLEVDFKLFSLVFKNLIDNGVKYSSDKAIEIKIDENKILFITKGEPLKDDFSKYIEPFFKGELNEINQKGFGLGLYIVNEIIKLHSFKFEYFHESGKNCFVIEY